MASSAVLLITVASVFTRQKVAQKLECALIQSTVDVSKSPYTVNISAISLAIGAQNIAVKGSEAYVTSSRDRTVKAVALPIKAGEHPVSISVGDAPNGIAANPTQNFVYVSNSGSNTVSAINTSTNAVSNTFTVGRRPTGVSVTPDGSAVYVTNQGDGTLSIITGTTVSKLFVGGEPTAIAIDSFGKRAYVTNHFCPTLQTLCNPDGHTSNGVVEVVDISATTKTVTCCIVAGQLPSDISLEPTGHYGYVVNSGSHSVTVFDTQTGTVVSTIFGILLNPQQNGPFIFVVP